MTRVAAGRTIRAMKQRLAITLLATLLAACGGQVPGGDPGGASEPGNDSTDAGGGNGGTTECRSGFSCVDGLAAELSAVPLPPSADEFAAPSDEVVRDARGTVSQTVFFVAEPADVIEFFESELPAAGFEITRSDGDDAARTFSIVTPDGQPGQLLVRSAVDPHGAQVEIEICVEDSCVF